MKCTRFALFFMLALLASWFLVGTTQATTLQYEANFDGLQEVPPNASPGFGLADLMLDDVSGALTITTGIYQDLLGGATAVTLNGAAPGTNGPIILVLTLDTPAANTGTFSGGGALTAGNATDMGAGNTYINIRSQVFPSGEIRGQIFAVPEPIGLGPGDVGVVRLINRRPADAIEDGLTSTSESSISWIKCVNRNEP